MDTFIKEIRAWGLEPYTGRGCYMKNKSLYMELMKRKPSVEDFVDLFDESEFWNNYEEEQNKMLTEDFVDLFDESEFWNKYELEQLVKKTVQDVIDKAMTELYIKDMLNEIVNKVESNNNPVGVNVTLEVSNQTLTRRIGPEYGITRNNVSVNLPTIINKIFPTFTLISYEIDEEVHVVNDYVYNENTLMDDYLDEFLFANMQGNCVSIFKKKYNLDDKYYDGMTMRDFIYACNEDNILIRNNYLQKVNDVDDPIFEVICYNGHITSLSPYEVKNICVRTNVELDDEEFEDFYLKCLDNPDQYVITNIRTYNGVYGKILKSFQLLNDTHTYKRKGLKLPKSDNICYTPTQVIKEMLRPYGCSFFNNYEKNHALYSGKANCGDYGYDLNQAFINAFKNIRKIPIIENFPVTYKRAMLIDSDVNNWVCVTDTFTYNNIKFPKSLLFLTEAIEYNAPILECFYISYYKKVNCEKLYNEMVKVIETNFNNESKYKHYDTLTKGKKILTNETINNRNLYVENCLRIALGNMERTCVEKYDKCYVSYLKNIFDEDKCSYILEPMKKLSVQKTFYINVHLAMSQQYRKMIMEIKNPKAVFCDCVYVESPIETSKYWKPEGQLLTNRICAKEYSEYEKFDVIVGGAGSGKTYEMMNRLNPENTLVIIPQYRLKLTWDGFECTSFQRIEKNFKFTNKPVICVDEAFQMDGKTINKIIGMATYYGIKLYLVGDPMQFQPVNKYNDARDACFKFMTPTEKITGNYRNNINYAEIFKTYARHNNPAKYLKSVFDKYLGKYLIDEDFNNPVYCFKTGSSNGTKIDELYKHIEELKKAQSAADGAINSANNKAELNKEKLNKIVKEIQALRNTETTQQKHERLYREYVSNNNIKDYYVRCIKNCEYRHKPYYNGVIYKVNPDIANSKHFVISNVYSIYTTQGQTMDKINLLRDDYESYYSSIEMVYVLISRLKTK